jgi:ATP-dependent Clp protease protease subunit
MYAVGENARFGSARTGNRGHSAGRPHRGNPNSARAATTQTTPPTAADAVYERLLEQRIVVLGREIDDDVANRMCAQLLLLANQDDDADISLYINPPGGSVTAGLAIYDTIQFVGCDVATCAVGTAASVGQFLLTSGTPGKRSALPHASILLHQPHAGVGSCRATIVRPGGRPAGGGPARSI